MIAIRWWGIFASVEWPAAGAVAVGVMGRAYRTMFKKAKCEVGHTDADGPPERAVGTVAR